MSGLNRIFDFFATGFRHHDVGIKEAHNPQVGMMWETPLALGINGFKILKVHSPKDVTVIEYYHPNKIQRVKWPEYFERKRGSIPSVAFTDYVTKAPVYYDVKYCGIEPVKDADALIEKTHKNYDEWHKATSNGPDF